MRPPALIQEHRSQPKNKKIAYIFRKLKFLKNIFPTKFSPLSSRILFFQRTSSPRAWLVSTAFCGWGPEIKVFSKQNSPPLVPLIFYRQNDAIFFFWSAAARKFTAKLKKICLNKKQLLLTSFLKKIFREEYQLSSAQLAQLKKWVSSARSAQEKFLASSARSAQGKVLASSAQLSSAIFFKICNSATALHP